MRNENNQSLTTNASRGLQVWHSIPVHTYDSLHWRQQLSLISDDDDMHRLQKTLARKEKRMYELDSTEDLDREEDEVFEEVFDLYSRARSCVKVAEHADVSAQYGAGRSRKKIPRGSVKGIPWT